MTAKNQYQAYQMATQTVSRTRQIVLLYDGAIRYMQQAREAVDRKDIPQRYNLLVRAGDIIVGLQNSLDFEIGGEIAGILHEFYARIDMEILSIHQTGSADMCEHVIRQLKKMRDAWHTIDQEKPAEAVEATSMPPAAASLMTATMLASVALSA